MPTKRKGVGDGMDEAGQRKSNNCNLSDVVHLIHCTSGTVVVQRSRGSFLHLAVMIFLLSLYVMCAQRLSVFGYCNGSQICLNFLLHVFILGHNWAVLQNYKYSTCYIITSIRNNVKQYHSKA